MPRLRIGDINQPPFGLLLGRLALPTQHAENESAFLGVEFLLMGVAEEGHRAPAIEILIARGFKARNHDYVVPGQTVLAHEVVGLQRSGSSLAVVIGAEHAEQFHQSVVIGSAQYGGGHDSPSSIKLSAAPITEARWPRSAWQTTASETWCWSSRLVRIAAACGSASNADPTLAALRKTSAAAPLARPMPSVNLWPPCSKSMSSCDRRLGNRARIMTRSPGAYQQTSKFDHEAETTRRIRAESTHGF
jgi:hypothetical protein